ncbi:MAG: aldehyde dehydrogenase family protein [Chitinophagaceae bacterium]
MELSISIVDDTTIIKPSDEAVHSGMVVEKIIKETFDESYIAVIQCAGTEVGTVLIGQYHFDHIFFTGSVRVGKLIMEMAAKHLSPVTLELGGKSPSIIDQDVNMGFAARKVAWSKLINAGQTWL